jgi:uncharacterized membrane protein HdeD (DUF308 family)
MLIAAVRTFESYTADGNVMYMEEKIQMGRAKMPGWARALAVVVGVISLIVGFLVLVFPGLGFLLVAYFIAFALLMLGADRIATGISGHTYEMKVVQTREQAPAQQKPTV